MGQEISPLDLAAFLCEVTESTARHQQTVADQTKAGFVFWCNEENGLDSVTSPYIARGNSNSTTFLVVPRPSKNKPPLPVPRQAGSISQEDAERYQEELADWGRHKNLYDSLFAARTPAESLELVVATGLLVTEVDDKEVRRHICVAPAEVVLDSLTATLTVEISDAFELEINWTPVKIRQLLRANEGELQALLEAESQVEVESAIAQLELSFGSDGAIITSRRHVAKNDTVGIGAIPAVLLRKKDTSAQLQALRDMMTDMQADGFVSEPFKMITDPKYAPTARKPIYDRAALPLPANPEQRSMINRARTEPHMVIQGPPGTGKTHTIANLAAVLMAEGRRVLITAENERALREVQSKLPPRLRPLMLPMLREGGKGAFEASVNALLTRANADRSASSRQRLIDQRLDELQGLEAQIDSAEEALIRVAEADRIDRTIQGVHMRLAGHLEVLSARSQEIALITAFLGDTAHATRADVSSILELFPVVGEAHTNLQQFRFPDALPIPADFATWLHEYRGNLAVLGDPSGHDYSSMAEQTDDLVNFATQLHQVTPIPWSEISHSSDDYATASERCSSVSKFVNHGITCSPSSDRSAAIRTMQAYLDLDSARFDQPISSLISQVESALTNVDQTLPDAEFTDYITASALTETCGQALKILLGDRSGLLNDYLIDRRAQRRSVIDQLIDDAKRLAAGSRPPLGLPVEVLEGAPGPQILLRQAETLAQHLNTGGRFKTAFGVPKPVKEALDLLANVRIGGSRIDSIEEVKLAIEYFNHRKIVATIDAWAADHSIEKPETVSHSEWINAITSLPNSAAQVLIALNAVDEVVRYAVGAPPNHPAEILRSALASISKEFIGALAVLTQAVEAQTSVVRIDGHEIQSRAEAETALASLSASVERDEFAKLLPGPWAIKNKKPDGDDDSLVKMLDLCAIAAGIPGEARATELSPGTVNRIVERAQTDSRRLELLAFHARTVSGYHLQLSACVPKSPATSAVADAITAEDAVAYRDAFEALDRERSMAENGTRLENALARVESAHPRLITALKLKDSDATHVLKNLEELQSLRDYRDAVHNWATTIGSIGSRHRVLAGLHEEQRKLEEVVAELRCWNSALDRLESKRELKAALSALTIAIGKVPKTRTAKTFPARMRALRSATKEAAPAIPCWVMTVDRVAEIIGYPTGENRFDVVIVDEASQSWFPSMFLYAIADQVIIVGDDLQTSPAEQVVKEDEIRSIVRAHIAGHRLAGQAGADLSLYDVAAVMTGPETMVDHFRCVPEIISLSNRLSYSLTGKTLKPSRFREPGSLEPVIHCPVNGERISRSAENPKERTAVVDQVIRCHADPRYDGMDFGVVVVGTSPTAQLKALNADLIERLGPGAMEHRKLEIGTPSQFQGAERNVMFLSLLDAAPSGERLRIWPHEHSGKNRRRVQQLNVAVSRAKDQLWIFRSFNLSDLAPTDARAVVVQSEVSSNPTLESQLLKCDSKFERDVVHALVTADPSLVIRTQVEALGYRLDIVIENTTGHRLAVECDGDRWHSEYDDVRSDLYRQRTLEKLGWRFDRFLASEWYADPASRTQEIFNRLSSLVSDSEPTFPEPIPPISFLGTFAPDDPHTMAVVDDAAEDTPSMPIMFPVTNPVEASEVFPTATPAVNLGNDGMPSRPSADRDVEDLASSMTRIESHRRLASELRRLGHEPRGSIWICAKRSLDDGATVEEAAANCAETS